MKLQDSHLVGSAIYKLYRSEHSDPVIMTPGIVMATSRQMHDFVFCRDCEQRLSTHGEQYVSNMVFRNDSFPLLDRLNVAMPIESNGGFALYSGSRSGIDVEKLAYYAISVLWRSAIHRWRTLGQQSLTVSLSDERAEEIRQYLRGERGFPEDIAVVVTVCRDVASQHLTFTPSLHNGGDDQLRYAMLVRGVYFRPIIGATAESLDLCCIHSSNRKIFVDDCSKHSLASFGKIHETAKVARNVESLKRQK